MALMFLVQCQLRNLFFLVCSAQLPFLLAQVRLLLGSQQCLARRRRIIADAECSEHAVLCASELVSPLVIRC